MWRKLRINPHYLNTPRGWRIGSVISLSLEQIEVFVQNENPIAGETSNFFKNTDFLHFFDKIACDSGIKTFTNPEGVAPRPYGACF